MTNEQLYMAIGIPMLFNAGLIGIMLAYVNAKFSNMDQRFAGVDRRLNAMDQKMDRRFDELRDLWRSELRRVEEVLAARLKHLEDR